LKSLNGLSGSALKAGQILQLPADEKKPAPAADAPASPAPAAGQLTHTVMPGEFLGGIARKYKVPLADLATLNNIPDPRKLQAGQLLKIPAGGRLPAAAPKPVEQQPAAAPAAQQPAAPATQPAPAAPVASPESAPDVPVIQADPAQPPVINLP
ncbi:MAG: LysM peptidoglycan-binding domain-containing protein, partial [Opitutaceae bacterium]|nr:LysM peptidoglycan-binding domain-containing protein [Opitutaceae bacterium]